MKKILILFVMMILATTLASASILNDTSNVYLAAHLDYDGITEVGSNFNVCWDGASCTSTQVPERVTGKYGLAPHFLGDDALQITDLGINFDHTHNLTIDMWVNRNNNSEAGFLFQFGQGNNNNWLMNAYFEADSGLTVNQYQTSQPASSRFLYSNASHWTPGTWQHLVITYNGTSKELIMYIDNVSIDSVTAVASGTNAYDRFMIGAGYNGNSPSNPSGSLEADVDEVILFDRVLSADEVSESYQFPYPFDGANPYGVLTAPEILYPNGGEVYLSEIIPVAIAPTIVIDDDKITTYTIEYYDGNSWSVADTITYQKISQGTTGGSQIHFENNQADSNFEITRGMIWNSFQLVSGSPDNGTIRDQANASNVWQVYPWVEDFYLPPGNYTMDWEATATSYCQAGGTTWYSPIESGGFDCGVTIYGYSMGFDWDATQVLTSTNHLLRTNVDAPGYNATTGYDESDAVYTIDNLDISITNPSTSDVLFRNDSVNVEWSFVNSGIGSLIYNIDYYNGSVWSLLKRTKGDPTLTYIGQTSYAQYVYDLTVFEVGGVAYMLAANAGGGQHNVDVNAINMTTGTIGSTDVYPELKLSTNRMITYGSTPDLTGDGVPVIIRGRNSIYTDNCNPQVYKYNSTGDNWSRRADLETGINAGDSKYCKLAVTENMKGMGEVDLIIVYKPSSSVAYGGYKNALWYNESGNNWVQDLTLVEGLDYQWPYTSTGTEEFRLGIAKDVFDAENVISFAHSTDVLATYYWDMVGETWISVDNSMTKGLDGDIESVILNDGTEMVYEDEGPIRRYEITSRANITYVDLSSKISTESAQLRINVTDDYKSSDDQVAVVVDNIVNPAMDYPVGGQSYAVDDMIVNWTESTNAIGTVTYHLDFYNGSVWAEITSTTNNFYNWSGYPDNDSYNFRVYAVDDYITTIANETGTFEISRVVSIDGGVDAPTCTETYPIEEGIAFMPVEFSLTSPNGVQHIGNETVTLSYGVHEIQFTDCIWTNTSEYTRDYTCAVPLEYHRPPANYNLKIEVHDTNKDIVVEYYEATACQYYQLLASRMSHIVINFETDVGENDDVAQVIPLIYNTGNVQLAGASIKAKDIAGETVSSERLAASNFEVNLVNNPSTAIGLIHDAWVNLTLNLDPGDGVYSDLYFFLSIPEDQYPQSYSTRFDPWLINIG